VQNSRVRLQATEHKHITDHVAVAKLVADIVFSPSEFTGNSWLKELAGSEILRPFANDASLLSAPDTTGFA
jgi:hypothetical protein